MFTDRLPPAQANYLISFTPFARTHFLKHFQKLYKGRSWVLTEQSIFNDLERITEKLQFTQQVDQLYRLKSTIWVFKYDFSVFQSNQSPKASGNRCVCWLNSQALTIEILLIYSKNDLPKNQGEQSYIETILASQYGLI